MTTALLGGAFDPPHAGHVALARAALDHLRPKRLLVLVNEAPGHRRVDTPGAVRVELAEAAFAGLPRTAVELDPHPFTVELLRARAFDDPVLLLGADQWAAFPTWKQPAEVLRLARVAVAVRAGFAPPAGVDGERVLALPLDSPPVSSSEVRRRVAAGEPIDGLVPPAVALLVRERGLYGGRAAAPDRAGGASRSAR